MAVLVEGCSDYVRNKYIEQFLKCVCTGITDNAGVVRNAALFALGQFSEHLQVCALKINGFLLHYYCDSIFTSINWWMFFQPEIAEYHEQLLPVLFQYLQQLCSRINQQGEGSKEPGGIDRMFYALEMFCENLGDRLVPYLPVLMESLFVSMAPTNSVHLRELAISAIAAAGMCCLKFF